MSKTYSKSVFSLEITRDNTQIKISAYTRSTDDEKTVRHYENKDISDAEIAGMCSSVVHLLNRANRQGKLDRRTLDELQATGQLLYDSLLTPDVKNKLTSTKAENLLMIVDDQLVHIPWELLFDGEDFLCRRFNMGRIVRTSQRISNTAVRKVQMPIRMLLIADPRSDLEEAYREGVCLRDELDNDHEIIEVNLRSSIVDATSVRASLRHYDILHYAGHADYHVAAPSESGFLMEGGTLSASDIMSMSGPAPLPSLVFSNACRSGHTDKWRVGDHYETEIYGLANAFLLAGVQHYIGSFWDVQDEPSLYFAMYFYRELIKGAMIGEAVKKARSGMVERYGEDTIIWASYMLYGDPTARYVDSLKSGKTDDTPEGPEAPNAEYEDGMELAGNIRGGNTEIVFPRRRNKWIAAGAAFLIIFASFLIISFLNVSRDATPPESNIVRHEPEQLTNNRRIDELVQALIHDYRENLKTGRVTSTGTHKSDVPTLVFLNIKANGMSEADKEYIFTGITETLRNTKRVKIVEREILERLLEELRLSSSQLGDPTKALEVGKILSAQIISTGSISRDGADWQVSLRLIDTETTSIQAALTESLSTKDKDKVSAMISREILNKIRGD